MKLQDLFESATAKTVIDCSSRTLKRGDIVPFFTAWRHEFPENNYLLPLVVNQTDSPIILAGQLGRILYNSSGLPYYIIDYAASKNSTDENGRDVKIGEYNDVIVSMRENTAYYKKSPSTTVGLFIQQVLANNKEKIPQEHPFLAFDEVQEYVRAHIEDSPVYDVLEDSFNDSVKLFPVLREYGMTVQEYYGNKTVGQWRKEYINNSIESIASGALFMPVTGENDET